MSIELLLFALDTALVNPAEEAGVDGFVIDWEWRDKEVRQAGANTQINCQGPDDLRRLRSLTRKPIMCRLNAWGQGSRDEMSCALALGADELLLPMVQGPEEVLSFLDHAAGRCKTGILVEQAAAVAHARELAGLPINRVYVGLNDLALSRRTDLFRPLVDGTLDELAQVFHGVPFGFGGLTHPRSGHPIPSLLLLTDLVRLGCAFTFLRRSFMEDQALFGLGATILAIREAWDAATRASAEERQSSRSALVDLVESRPIFIRIKETLCPDLVTAS